jgi:hypothetical protein
MCHLPHTTAEEKASGNSQLNTANGCVVRYEPPNSSHMFKNQAAKETDVQRLPRGNDDAVVC